MTKQQEFLDILTNPPKPLDEVKQRLIDMIKDSNILVTKMDVSMSDHLMTTYTIELKSCGYD